MRAFDPCLLRLFRTEPDVNLGQWVDYLCRSRLQSDTAAAWSWLIQASESIASECKVEPQRADHIVEGVLKLARMRDADPALLDRLLREAISKHKSATSGLTGRGVLIASSFCFLDRGLSQLA